MKTMYVHNLTGTNPFTGGTSWEVTPVYVVKTTPTRVMVVTKDKPVGVKMTFYKDSRRLYGRGNRQYPVLSAWKDAPFRPDAA